MATTPGLVQARQRERLVAALTPRTTAAPALASADKAAALALPVLLSRAPARLDHRIVLLDECGRVREATLFRSLGWEPGSRVAVEDRGDRLVLRADATGPLALDRRGRLAVPDALRKLRGWSAGEPVLLSASPADGLLFLSPTRSLDPVVLHDCA